MTTTAQWQQRWNAVMLGNYGTPPLVLETGQGMHVTDADGKVYVDMLAGIAVNVLGHSHPALVEAISRQAQQLMHVSNLAMHPRGIELAERLIAITGWDGRVFFSQDGATANEAALKIARRYGAMQGQGGAKQRIVAMEGGFHGRTMGALAVTGNPGKREPFAPFGHDVTFVPFGDIDAVERAIGADVAAVIVEPIQGENGVVVPPANFLPGVRSLCSRHAALLIVDEVQSGVGRTGSWFASTALGVVPDVMTLGKGLAGGLPLGATVVTGAARDALRPGDHGTTFGGNPVACAAALAVLDVIESQDLLANARAMGSSLRDQIASLGSPHVGGVRGEGLWLGIVFNSPIASQVEIELRARGFLTNAAKPEVLRIAPPLIIEQHNVDAFAGALGSILRDLM